MAGRLGSSTATLRRTSTLVAASALLLLLAVAVGTSPARNLRGTNRGEKIVGTKGADTIKGMSGNDKIMGKQGNDELNGGNGRDTVIGGAGADKMLGGAGNDVIKAADGRRDKVINGGGGKNRCVIDTTLELSIARNCSSIVGASSAGSGPGPGPGAGLRVLSATGLVCASSQPTCVFTASGDGANGTVGTVTGGGGVTAVGGSVTPSGSDWTAGALYGCNADGFLRVTIGSEFVDLPVDCTV
jgi:RTX calcium-binding nonapeptide repeat (4 copies)